jgi:hypothetical protein
MLSIVRSLNDPHVIPVRSYMIRHCLFAVEVTAEVYEEGNGVSSGFLPVDFCLFPISFVSQQGFR